MLDQDYYEEAVKNCQRLVPGLRIVSKADSFLHKLISVLLYPILRSRYMTMFWTTIGKTVAHPRTGHGNAYDVLYHETKHASVSTPWDWVGYLFPIWLFPVFLGGLLFFGFGYWSLISLVFLLPLPAYWRMKHELEAYKVSISVEYWRRGWVPNLEWYVEQFTGQSYYFMWPFKQNMRKRLQAHYDQLRDPNMLWRFDKFLNSVYEHMKANGMVRNG